MWPNINGADWTTAILLLRQALRVYRWGLPATGGERLLTRWQTPGRTMEKGDHARAGNSLWTCPNGSGPLPVAPLHCRASEALPRPGDG